MHRIAQGFDGVIVRRLHCQRLAQKQVTRRRRLPRRVQLQDAVGQVGGLFMLHQIGVEQRHLFGGQRGAHDLDILVDLRVIALAFGLHPRCTARIGHRRVDQALAKVHLQQQFLRDQVLGGQHPQHIRLHHFGDRVIGQFQFMQRRHRRHTAQQEHGAEDGPEFGFDRQFHRTVTLQWYR